MEQPADSQRPPATATKGVRILYRMFNFESFVPCLEGVVHFAVAGFEPTFDFSFSLVLATVNHKRVRNKAHTAEYRDTCRTRKVKRSRIEEAGRGNGVMEQWRDGAMERWIFHIGKTEWSCSILTAIKRRNPLCLLNPIVLNISW